MKKKKKKYKRNPMGEGLLVVNPSRGRSYKRNPKWLGRSFITGMFDKQLPIQVGVLTAGAGLSRVATAKILGENDTGLKSLAVQPVVGLVGGLAIKNFLKQALLGRFFFMGSVFHAGWRFLSTKLTQNMVPGFEYGDVYRESAAAPQAAGASGLYLDEGEDTEEIGVAGVGEAYGSAY